MNVYDAGIKYTEHDGYISFETYVRNERVYPYFCFKHVDTFSPYEYCYYSKDKFEFEGKILFDIGDSNNFHIVKNKTIILLKDYVETCPPEEATYLKLKYL